MALKLKIPPEKQQISDEDITTQNNKYFIQRVNELGIDGAIKEYQKHFGSGPKRKYSIRKK